MPYAVPDDVRDALNPTGSSTDVGSASGMTEDALTAAIGRAQDEIDARLRGTYAVPFPDPVPGLVKDVTIKVAAYLATLTFRQGEVLDTRAPVWLAYEDALDVLKGLADGSILLPPEDAPPAPGTGPGGVTVINQYAGDLFRPCDFDLAYRWPRGRCG